MCLYLILLEHGPCSSQVTTSGHSPQNAHAQDGWTAIMHAARNGHVSCVRTLLNAGADANLKNNDGKTALELAQMHKHDEVAKALSTRKNEVAKPGPSSVEAEIAALESEIAALEGGHNVVPQPSQLTSGFIQRGELQIGNQLGSGPSALCTRHCGRATWSLSNRSAASGWKAERARKRSS